jgi:hypothetical protein
LHSPAHRCLNDVEATKGGVSLAKQRLEKVAEPFATDTTIAGVAIAAEASGGPAAELESFVPTWRGPKILAVVPVLAELIVGGTFLRVL